MEYRVGICAASIILLSLSPLLLTTSTSNSSGLSICGFHCWQRDKANEQSIASITNRYAPNSTGIPGRKLAKNAVSDEAEICTPLGIRGASAVLRESMKALAKRRF